MTKNIFITDFSDPMFRTMFKQYFAELEINVKDWEGLFEEMNTHNGGNCAYIRICDGKPAGFIQFTTVTLENWFFKERIGFIREFWVSKELRKQGNGSALYLMAEKYFADHGIRRVVLTAEEKEKEFYFKRGYSICENMEAKNEMPVLEKEI